MLVIIDKQRLDKIKPGISPKASIESTVILGKDITKTIKRIEKISAAFGVNFFISASLDEKDVPDELKELIEVSL